MTTSRSAAVSLPTDTAILITREFDAPAHLVYRAWTEPELIRRWWHAKRGEVTVCEADLRVGGRYRNVMVTPDGTEVAFHGEYREIVPNERLVATEVYEAVSGGPDQDEPFGLNTLTFEERDGRTTVSLLAEYFVKEARDMVVASGMEEGLQDALDLLEEVAISLR